jgi:hypothetical protein
MLYAERIRGRGWRSLLRRSWQVWLVLAAAFVVYDAATGTPWASLPLYRLVLIVTLFLLLPHVFFWRQKDPVESLVRSVGTVILIVAVLHDNLPGFWPWRVSLEVYGIGAFTLSLGVVTARRFFADQRELAAVERELTTARSIQRAILPRTVPSLGSGRVAVRYVPVNSVAGDLYGFLSTGERRLGVLVADVAGHGVPAALIGSMTTAAFAGQEAVAAEPDRILAEINRVLCRHLEARFVTGAYAYVDLERRLVSYSLAGHPPLLLVKPADGRVCELGERGTVLGWFADARYPATTVAFEPGDRLILYTDGLTDVTNRAGVWFGDGELQAFVAANRSLSADRFVDALVDHVARWSERGPHFEDDLTIVVVDAEPPGN